MNCGEESMIWVQVLCLGIERNGRPVVPPCHAVECLCEKRVLWQPRIDDVAMRVPSLQHCFSEIPESSVRTPKWVIPKSVLTSVSTSDRALRHRRRKFCNTYMPQGIFKTATTQEAGAWRFSAMFLFRVVRNVAPYSLSNVFANVGIVERAPNRSYRRGRYQRGCCFSTRTGWSSKDNADLRRASPKSKFKDRHTSRGQRNAVWKAPVEFTPWCRPFTSAVLTSARNVFGCACSWINTSFRLPRPAPAMTGISTARVLSYPWTWKNFLTFSSCFRLTVRS